MKAVCGYSKRRVYYPAQFVCAGAHSGIFPYSAQCINCVFGQIHLRPLRHYSKRDAFRTRVGRACDLGFSNTTPLPAKIYANEGVAQMLFLKVMKFVKPPMAIATVNIRADGVTLP